MCFWVSTVYTIVLLLVYVMKRDANIPLTYRTAFNDWASVQNVLRNNPNGNGISLWNTKISDIMWCSVSTDLTTRLRVSPQCSCVFNFLNSTYKTNALAYQNISGLGDTQAQSVLDSCLRSRSTWKKDTCDFCKIHLSIPILVACLCLSVLISRVSQFSSHLLQQVGYYLPIILALGVIACTIWIDLVAGIPASLTVISVLIEASYTCSCSDDISVYWSYQRYFIGSLAVWAAVTHQARDIYLSASYGTMGYFIGLLAYTICITRFKKNTLLGCCNTYVWTSICCIAVSFVLLIQQHWYSNSPFYSSIFSVVCLMIVCFQCICMLPGLWHSDVLQIVIGLALLSICFASILSDLISL